MLCREHVSHLGFNASFSNAQVNRAGEKLHEIDGVDAKSLAREEILQKLRDCSGIQLRGQGRPQKEHPVGFDSQSGLETGSLGRLTVAWSDPPMVLGMESRPQVLLAIDGNKVFGMTKEKIEELVEASPACHWPGGVSTTKNVSTHTCHNTSRHLIFSVQV